MEIGLNIKYDGNQKSSFAGIIQEYDILAQLAFFKDFGSDTELIRESLGTIVHSKNDLKPSNLRFFLEFISRCCIY